MISEENKVINICKNMIRFSRLEAEKGGYLQALEIIKNCEKQFQDNLQKIGVSREEGDKLITEMKELKEDYVIKSKQPLIVNINYDMVSPPK